MVEFLSQVIAKVRDGITTEFNANNMLLLTKYQAVVSSEDSRYNTFIKRLQEFVKGKAHLGFHTCTYDIPEDLLHRTQDILQYLIDLGFEVIDMGKYNNAFEGSIGISWKYWHVM